MNPLLTLLTRRTQRANFLSVGVVLCSIVAAICVAPLAFVHQWVAIWLLTVMTILVLGTFAVFVYYALRFPHLLNTESHVEQMAAISVLGSNKAGQPAIIQAIDSGNALANPMLSDQGQGQ